MQRFWVLIGAMWWVSACNCGTGGLQKVAPAIEVEPRQLDFGPVPVGLSASLPVEVRNEGQATLNVSPFISDNAEFSGPADSFSIEPASSQAVEINFAPTVEGQRDGVVHVLSNAGPDAGVLITVTGIGVSRLVCGDCSNPPPSYCAGPSVLISYEPSGTCVDNQCQYRAMSTICSGTCVAANRACSNNDGGMGDAGRPDAGSPSCIGAGTTFYQSGALIGTQYTHCISDVEEQKGLTVGKIITATSTDVHASIAGRAVSCCSKQIEAKSYANIVCLYGAWRLECR